MRIRRVLALFAAGVGVGALVSWLRGPDAPVFREGWPAHQPWPPIAAGDEAMTAERSRSEVNPG